MAGAPCCGATYADCCLAACFNGCCRVLTSHPGTACRMSHHPQPPLPAFPAFPVQHPAVGGPAAAAAAQHPAADCGHPAARHRQRQGRATGQERHELAQPLHPGHCQHQRPAQVRSAGFVGCLLCLLVAALRMCKRRQHKPGLQRRGMQGAVTVTRPYTASAPCTASNP